MTDAIWLPHPTYVHYEISDDGRVRSIDRVTKGRNGSDRTVRGRELVLGITPTATPYLHASLWEEGVGICKPVHVLVCETFHGPKPDSSLQVRHLNGMSFDNRAENLAWGTESENKFDMVRHGNHHNAIKTHCKRGHPFDDVNTYRSPGRPGIRACRSCVRERQRRRQARLALKP